MNLHRRKCAFTPSRFYVLVEIDGKLGYDIDGEFTPVSDAPKTTARKKPSPNERLKTFLDESAHMRKLIAEGAVMLSVDSQGCIYCHSTPEFFKFHSEIGKNLKENVRDIWAQARFEENERIIADLRQTGGHLPGRNGLKTIPSMKRNKPIHSVRDMLEDLVYP